MNLGPSVTVIISLIHFGQMSGVARRRSDFLRSGSWVQVHLCPAASLCFFHNTFPRLITRELEGIVFKELAQRTLRT